MDKGSDFRKGVFKSSFNNQITLLFSIEMHLFVSTLQASSSHDHRCRKQKIDHSWEGYRSLIFVLDFFFFFEYLGFD